MVRWTSEGRRRDLTATLAIALFVGSVVVSTASAQTQPESPNDDVAAEPAVPSETSPDTGADDQAARRLFLRGTAAFEAGRFDDALTQYRLAHELSQRDVMLYNVALCLERLGRTGEALATYQAYIGSNPEAANRADVEARVRQLRASSEARAPSEAQAPDPIEPPAPSPSRPVGAWVSFAVGAASVATGAVLVGVGARRISTLEATAPETRQWDEVREESDGARTLQIAGYAVLGVGIALGVVGAILRARHRSGGAEVGAGTMGWRF